MCKLCLTQFEEEEDVITPQCPSYEEITAVEVIGEIDE